MLMLLLLLPMLLPLLRAEVAERARPSRAGVGGIVELRGAAALPTVADARLCVSGSVGWRRQAAVGSGRRDLRQLIDSFKTSEMNVHGRNQG